MTEVRDNPLGVEGFEFVEFAGPDARPLHGLFQQMGFAAIAKHASRNITLYRQGDINFLVNEEPGSFAARFAAEHGPCCTGFALRVADAGQAYQSCISKGAESMSDIPGAALDGPRIRGIGGSMLYLVDRKGGSAWVEEYELLPGADPNHKGYGLTFIDHLTHNVYFGNMDEWADFYARLFGFYEVRYFDIRGQQTGLKSRAMTSPDGAISIPINEYLDQYHGEGVQHVALYTEDIYATVEGLRAAGLGFLDTPDTYYEVVNRRVSEHEEDLERMRRNRILIDADQETGKKLLLQIFTQTEIGPIFFEIIERKGNRGFGEGNFTALFESIELDQMRRGVL
jgi:4-hydroxyphenylpyruvate dioxygenase